jgi:hypothetical protein
MILCLGGDTLNRRGKEVGIASTLLICGITSSPHSNIMLIYIHRLSLFLMRSISKKTVARKRYTKNISSCWLVKKMANIFEWNLIFILLTSKIVRTHNTKATKLNKIASINYIFFFLAIFEMPCTKMKHLVEKLGLSIKTTTIMKNFNIFSLLMSQLHFYKSKHIGE